MASLRDQLLKTGLASKRDVRRTNQELKKERREKQANRESRREREQRLERERQAQIEAVVQQKLAERRARQALAEQEARQQQVDQILRHHARQSNGRYRFWHRPVSGTLLGRLEIPEWMAEDLRLGRMGVVAARALGEWEYLVVAADVARRVLGLLPERVVHYNETPPDPRDPAEQLLDPGW